jgi:hypothetical protein
MLVGLAQIRKASGVALVSGLNLTPFDWQPLSVVVSNNKESAVLLANNNNYCSQLNPLSIDKLVPKIIKRFMDTLPPDFIASPLPNKAK